MRRRQLTRPVLLICALAGCASGAGRAVPASGDACVLAGDAADPGSRPPARLVLAVSGTFDPAQLRRPRTAAERLVSSQLYETLVTVDCGGGLKAGLASAWRRASDGRSWIFTLRADARFTDGSALTARDVADGWMSALPRAIASITVLAAHELQVELTADAAAEPGIFADPVFAVARASPGNDWPLGTGRYAVADAAADARAGSLLLEPVAGAGGPALEIRFLGGSDARNALDDAADVVLTASPLALDYARSHPAYEVVPLPWDVLYALVVPERGPASGEAPASLRDELARDVVAVSARPAARQESPCPGSRALAAGSRRILFARGDDVAAALADRLVALAASPASDERASFVHHLLGAGRIPASPTDASALAAALGRGEEAAYIVSLPARAPDVCTALPATARSLVLPLVETRPSVILRRGVRGVTVDGNGTLRFGSA